MSSRFGQIVAGLGALAGGYVQGKRINEADAREAERQEWEREERERIRAERQASASTLGQVGKTTGAAASGEDALAAGNQAMENAIAGAGSQEEAAAIRGQYAPTIEALTAQRGTAEQAGTTYTQEQAQGDFVKKMYGIDATKAAQAESSQLQLEGQRDDADKRRTARLIDADLRGVMGKSVKKDEDGNDVLDNDGLSNMFKARVLVAMKHGRADLAEAAATDGMTFNTRRIQAETAQRVADTDNALRVFDKDPKAGLSVYNKYVPDGSTATDVVKNKDGSVTVKRVSSIDGAVLPSEKFENMGALRATIESMKDPNAVIAHVDRTFRHDIESRKVAADESRAGSAAKVASAGVAREARAEKREDALIAANVAYQSALDSGDAKALKAARAAVVAAGGKMEKAESVKGEFKPNPMGMGGTVVQTNPDGSVRVTPVQSSTKGPVTVGAPGATAGAAQPKTQAEFDAMKSGTVYVDPEDGKTYRKP